MEAFVSVRFGHVGGPWVSALLIAGFLGIATFGIRDALRQNVRWRRLTLLSLRVLTAGTALLFCLQPEWIRERVEQVQGRVLVLADASRSMSVRDGSETRASRVLALLRAFANEGKPGFDLYTFGAEPSAARLGKLEAPLLAREDDTRIGRAVERVTKEIGEDLGAIVLISDGAEQSPNFSAQSLKKLGVRIHTVGFQNNKDLKDDGIVMLKADPLAFLRQAAEVQVQVRGATKSSTPLVVSLREGDAVVSEATVELDAEGRGMAVLSFTPTRIGRSVYRVSLPVSDGDAIPENNERAFLVRVTRDKLRVLLLCGAPTWDTRFLRAFLKADPAIDLITFFILRTNSDLAMASPEELSLIPFPTDELFRQHLDSFDLVIFQDFNYGPYQVAGYLPRIHDYVMAGGSFAMIGGDRAFGAGGYDRTALAESLPVTMQAGEASLSEQVFTPALVPEMARHPIVELVVDTRENAKAWSALAPLLGANRLLGLREGAVALLTHPSEKDAQGGAMPVLAVGPAGQGRVLALAADSSWRWGITTGGLIGDASAYDRFWDRALRWLARDPLLEPSHVETDKESYGPSALLKAQLRLRDERYAPLSKGPLELLIIDPQGRLHSKEPLQTDAEGIASAELRVPADLGAYRLAARDPASERLIAEQDFLVESGGDELADPFARPELLAEIAQVTGGTFHDAKDPPKLSSLDRSRARRLNTVISTPFLSPFFVALLVAAFAAEWMLRRAYGLR